jgi:hypothetical protein
VHTRKDEPQNLIAKEVAITSNLGSAADLLGILAPEMSQVEGVLFEVRPAPRYRDALTGTTILIAVVGGTSAALSALINGLFRIFDRHGDRSGKIVIRGSDGRTVEAPADFTDEQVERLIAFAHELDSPTVYLQSGGKVGLRRDREN